MGPDQLAKSPALSNSPHSGKIKSQMRTVRAKNQLETKGCELWEGGCETRKALPRCWKAWPAVDSCHPGSRPQALSQAWRAVLSAGYQGLGD